ncbi:hypothetical protein [uncultured Turicimonas sp.]|uniref:hypothetical protein n=1 Tax=uncultured Turicimonas sp. TaxID=1918607 RepID=UPI003211C801
MRNNELFEKHSVVLTLLAPIHIGCEDEYEPTNFVVDHSKRLLFFFDPSLVPLTIGQRDQLGNIAKSASISSISRFYNSHLDLFSAFASSVIPYDSIAGKTIEKLLQGNIEKDLKIPRTIYTVSSSLATPYIPGSSVKGGIHTAYLDRMALSSSETGLQNKELDEKLLGGKMDQSPMKLISIADFFQTSNDVSRTRIVGAKRLNVKDAPVLSSKGIPSFLEALVPGQYRAFLSEISLKSPNPEDKVNKSIAYKSVAQILKDLHRFNYAQFKEQSSYWRRADPLSKRWLESVEKLLASLGPKFERGEAALIRLGKNSGAQNYTIRKPGFPHIKSMKGKGLPPDYVNTPKSVTCAVLNNSRFQGLLPFGWALLELDPKKEELIRNWCTELNDKIPLSRCLFNVEAKKNKVKLLEKREQALREQKQQQHAEEEKRAREEEEAREMAKLSDNLRRLKEIVKEIEKTPKVLPGTELHKKVVLLVESALGWEKEEKQCVASALTPYIKIKELSAGDAGRKIKANLRLLKDTK